MSTTLVCICGLSAEQHGAGMTDHPPLVQPWAQQLRDTQHVRMGKRRGHYAVTERRVVSIPAPLAGVDLSALAPQNGQWDVISLVASLTTSATVANRVPHIIIQDANSQHTVFNSPAINNQLAGTTVTYCAARTGMSAWFDNAIVIPLPGELTLLGLWGIAFSTTALQAGDTWSALALLVDETLYY